MNTIEPISFSSRTNLPQTHPAKNPAVSFQGLQGDKFVSRLQDGLLSDSEEILSSVKGRLGLSREKIKDVLDSFIARIKTLNKENYELKEQNKQLQGELNKYREEMSRVKPLEELSSASAQKVISTIHEMTDKKITARESLYNYIMTGSGQEEALNQIQRNIILQKAHKDGLTQNPEVQEALGKSFEKIFGSVVDYTMNMLTETLSVIPNSEILTSRATKEQIRFNVMALFNNIANKDSSYYSKASYNELLTSAIDKAADRVILKERGKKLLLASDHITLPYDRLSKDIPTPFDFENSSVKFITSQGKEFSVSYPDLVSIGQNPPSNTEELNRLVTNFIA